MASDEIILEEIVLAAWLHDVGKFAQRADVSELYDEGLERQYCKITKDGRYTHQHVIYTEGFLSKYRDVLPDSVNWEHVKDLAANHHNPSSYYDWIIAEADRLSSGSDRCNILGEKECDENQFDEEKEKLKFYEKPMLHILSSLQLDDKPEPEKAYCKMAVLDNDNVLSDKEYKTSKEEYKNLWDDFVKNFQKLQNLSYDNFLLSLNSLLERYWWCIPSATNVDTDISLYQHSKTTAAFAATMYQYQKEINAEKESDLKKYNEEKFMFINGDISGIQKYIFDLKTTKDNAKLLRAKSFQLWALGEILSQYITKQFEVSYANIMTSAGGKFIILVPNTDKAKKLLPQIQLEIEEYFLNEFAGKLAVIISEGKAASCYDLQRENVQTLINQIGDEADIAKSKKMQKVLQKYNAVLEEQYDDLQKNGECPKCGVFAAFTPEGEDDERECTSCKILTDIGRKLVKSAKVVLKTDKLLQFGQMIKLYKENQDCDFSYSINEYKAGHPVMYLPYVAPKFSYLADNDIEKLKLSAERENSIDFENDLLTFEDIANLSTGNKKLAMFKADIDNLGLVFSQSLGDRMSFSRYADLSHMLHYFFSSFYAWFVNSKTDQHGKLYKERIYTVFSGGDDLCILGSWDTVLQFALDFRKALTKFTNNNPSVTISGGITLVNSKVPVRNIADEAEELLEKSKGKDGKNAITVFGTTVSWEEYEKCLEDGKFLQEQLELNKTDSKKGVSTGVIYKFLDFANRAERLKEGNIGELLQNKKWQSHFYYIISRNIKDNEELRDKLKSFGTSANNENISNEQKMINSRIAVSYALFTQR